MEALYALYSRSHFSDDEIVAIVYPMYTSEMIDLLGKLFAWSAIDSRDIDDEKYLFAKKLSEVGPDENMSHSANSCVDGIESRHLYRNEIYISTAAM